MKHQHRVECFSHFLQQVVFSQYFSFIHFVLSTDGVFLPGGLLYHLADIIGCIHVDIIIIYTQDFDKNISNVVQGFDSFVFVKAAREWDKSKDRMNQSYLLCHRGYQLVSHIKRKKRGKIEQISSLVFFGLTFVIVKLGFLLWSHC